MSENFAKLNDREKNRLADWRKLIPTTHSFQIFLVIFFNQIMLLAYFTSAFVWENQISLKLISAKWINLADSRN